MPVVQVVHGARKAVCLHEREKFFGLVRTYQIALQAECVVFGQYVPIFIEAIRGCRQAQAACGVPAGALAGFGLQFLIKLNAVLVQTGICSCRCPLDNIAGGDPR